MMTDDSYPHTFKKRVQIQKRGMEFRIEGAPACSLMFFSGRGTRVLRRGYVPSRRPPVAMYGHIRGLMRGRDQGEGAHGFLFQGVFAP